MNRTLAELTAIEFFGLIVAGVLCAMLMLIAVQSIDRELHWFHRCIIWAGATLCCGVPAYWGFMAITAQ